MERETRRVEGEERTEGVAAVLRDRRRWRCFVWMSRLQRIQAAVERLAPARLLLQRRYERRFRTARGAGALCGAYASFAEAARAAPMGAAVGYDRAEAGGMYRDRMDDITPKDYPALFWLREALVGARTVFDIGGHVGLAFYAFRRYVPYPPGLRWIVCDVPAVTAEGAAIAAQRGESALTFTTDPTEASGVDVLLAAGSLQYIERPLGALLGAMARPPRHVIVNQTPTHTGREFFTLQNIGVAICPYRIARVEAIPESLGALGYELVDQWEDPSRRTAVPYHPALSPIAYSGYYLRRRDA